MTDFEALRREIEAQLAECRRLLEQRRPARLDGADDDEDVGVGVPVDRTPRSPQRDVAHASCRRRATTWMSWGRTAAR